MMLPYSILSFVAQSAVNGLWQGLLIVAMVALSLRLLPQMRAAIRFAVWGLTFAALLALPLARSREVAEATGSGNHAVLHVSEIWGVAISALWGLLFVWRAGLLLSQAMRLRTIWRNSVVVDADAATLTLLHESGRKAVLCTSKDVDSPCVIGFFSPKLLVPEWLYARLSEDELRQILLHECEHLRRRDDWMNLLQKIGLAIFPLNPALLWIDRRLGLEREMACDDGVVARTDAPFEYARCLTRLAEHGLQKRTLALALAAWSRESELGRRVHGLLEPVRAMSLMQTRAVIGLVTLGLAGGAVEMAHIPNLVAFSRIAHVASVPVLQPPTGALPVMYREDAKPRVVMTSAKMTPQVKRTAKQAGAMPVKRQRPMNPLSTRAVLIRANDTAEHVHMYQTMQYDEDEIRMRVIPAEYVPTYAAVPVGNGWLIIKL